MSILWEFCDASRTIVQGEASSEQFEQQQGDSTGEDMATLVNVGKS
jgi:hypothetical protein